MDCKVSGLAEADTDIDTDRSVRSVRSRHASAAIARPHMHVYTRLYSIYRRLKTPRPSTTAMYLSSLRLGFVSLVRLALASELRFSRSGKLLGPPILGASELYPLDGPAIFSVAGKTVMPKETLLIFLFPRHVCISGISPEVIHMHPLLKLISSNASTGTSPDEVFPLPSEAALGTTARSAPSLL